MNIFVNKVVIKKEKQASISSVNKRLKSMTTIRYKMTNIPNTKNKNKN